MAFIIIYLNICTLSNKIAISLLHTKIFKKIQISFYKDKVKIYLNTNTSIIKRLHLHFPRESMLDKMGLLQVISEPTPTHLGKDKDNDICLY